MCNYPVPPDYTCSVVSDVFTGARVESCCWNIFGRRQGHLYQAHSELLARRVWKSLDHSGGDHTELAATRHDSSSVCPGCCMHCHWHNRLAPRLFQESFCCGFHFHAVVSQARI